MPSKNTVEMRMYLDIQDFHKKFELPSFNSFAKMPDNLIAFREKFLVEEATETFEALVRKDHPEALDGLIDLAYVALGTFYLGGGSVTLVAQYSPLRPFGILDVKRISNGIKLEKSFSQLGRLLDIVMGCRTMAQQLGWFFDTGWDRVHVANMSKVRTKSEGDSKRGSAWDVVKPEGWVAPKMEDLV